MNKRKLNLGAGNAIKDPSEWINHDKYAHHEEIEVVHDLNKMPWPWKDEQFEYVAAKSVFEHLDKDLVEVVDECWRILEVGGVLKVKLPNAEDWIGCWHDPTHRRPYTLRFIEVFDVSSKNTGCNFYTKRKWKVLDLGGAGNKNQAGVWTSIFAEMEKVV